MTMTGYTLPSASTSTASPTIESLWEGAIAATEVREHPQEVGQLYSDDAAQMTKLNSHSHSHNHNHNHSHSHRDSHSHHHNQHSQPNSGGSDPDDPLHDNDERRARRMLSNRESARRSRQRKQQHLDQLRTQAQHLRLENATILNKLHFAARHYGTVTEENRQLRAEALELQHRLQCLRQAVNLPVNNKADVAC